MSQLTFLSENFVNDASLSVITGTEDAQFPVDNIKDIRTTKVFRSTDNTVEIQVDLLVTQAIDSFAIVGNSAEGLGFTALTIYGSASTDFSLSTPIVIDLNAENNIGFKLFDEVPFRFWKLEFTGTGSYTEVSNIFLGKKEQFTENSFSINSFRYSNDDISRVRKNSFNQPFVDRRARIKNINGRLLHMNADEYDIVNEIIVRHGTTEPIWIITDPEGCSATDAEFVFSMYALIRKIPNISSSGFGLYNASFTLEQIG